MKRLLLALALSLATAMPATASEPLPQRQEALRHLLVQDCGSCHGLRLRGGLGPALLPEVLAQKPRELLVMTIENGRPGTAMPPWSRFLGPGEAEWLVSLLLEGNMSR